MGIHFKEKVKCTHIMPRYREVLFQCIESCSIVLKFVPDSETVEEHWWFSRHASKLNYHASEK